MMGLIVFIIIGYLFGCVNGSQIIGKLKNIDIKNSGVKNPGASNTTILLGWKYGAIVALIDIGKAIIPIVILKLLLDDPYFEMIAIYTTGFSVIIGHIFPITMKFKGGKGTASLIGMLVAIDWKIASIGIGILIMMTLLTDYLVVGVHLMYLSFISTTYWFGFGIAPICIAIVLTLISIYLHVENYKRITNKTETKISSLLKKK